MSYELNLHHICKDYIDYNEDTTILEALKNPDNLIFVSIDNLETKTPHSMVINKNHIINYNIPNTLCQEIDENGQIIDPVNQNGKQIVSVMNILPVIKYIDRFIIHLIQKQIEENICSKIFVFMKNTIFDTDCSEDIQNYIYRPVDYTIVVYKIENENENENENEPEQIVRKHPEYPQPPRSVSNILSSLKGGLGLKGKKNFSKKNKKSVKSVKKSVKKCKKCKK